MKNLVLLVCLSLTCVNTLYAQEEPDLGTEAQRAAGKELYEKNCAQCHGDTGDGAGVAAPYLLPRPRDFTSGLFKFRTTTSGDLPTDEDLKRSIRYGMPYTSMPAWPTLSEAQIQNLVYYIKTFNDDFAGPYGLVEPIEIPDPPRFSEESARRGRDVYVENECSKCHGELGRGDGPSAPTLEDQWGDPIRAADLTKRWTFRNGTTRRDIYRTFTTGLDGTPMPAFEIPPEDRWALVDYIYSLSRDDPEYGTVVRSKAIFGELDIRQGAALFEEAEATYFPVVGQIIEPGRSFVPGVDGVEVKAVHNEEEMALLLVWHDRRADRTGHNSLMPDRVPPGTVPADTTMGTLTEPEAITVDTTAGIYSDAVAVQIPSAPSEGIEKPYFLSGDARHPVDLWFADLAGDSVFVYTGRGSSQIEPAEGEVDFFAHYDNGAWTAVFKRKRFPEEGFRFEEGQFVPVAFSFWDGFYQEHGNKRGITSWYHVYVSPMQTQSAALPMVKYGLFTFLIEVMIVSLVRWRHKKRKVTV